MCSDLLYTFFLAHFLFYEEFSDEYLYETVNTGILKTYF
jgi:hypothetical protein